MVNRPKSTGKIEIDLTNLNSDSPSVVDRLQRIENNYQLFDQLYTELEPKLSGDSDEPHSFDVSKIKPR